MSRSDSGYRSNMSGHPCYYGDPSSVLQEEAAEYQGEDSTGTWQYQYSIDDVEATYDQQQLSNYMVEGTGSQMAAYYPDTPRTATGLGPARDTDFDDDNNGPCFGEEGMAYWSAQPDLLSHYPHGAYHGHAAGLGTMPPSTQNGGSQTAYFELSASQAAAAAPSSSTSHPRHREASAKPATTTSATMPPTGPDGQHRQHSRRSAAQIASLTSAATAATTGASTSTSTGTNKFPCLVRSCNKQFNRAADLDRHMKFIHYKATVRAMLCDYRRCPRHREPFHRADHFRDHLRDQHKEDLPKRGERAHAPDDAWWRERSPAAVYGGWWRCSKCFARVVVGAAATDADANNGADDVNNISSSSNSAEEGGAGTGTAAWRCAGCGNYCEGERQAARKLPRRCEYAECAERRCGHGECVGEPVRGLWRSPAGFRAHLRNCHGEDVPVNEGRDGERELESDEWWRARWLEAVCSPVWRCTRCLDAVDSREDGFVCRGCGFACEEARRGSHRAA